MNEISREEFDVLATQVKALLAGATDNEREIAVQAEQNALSQSVIDQYRSTIDGILSNWKEMLIKPMPIDAYAIAMWLVMSQVVAEVERQDENGCMDCYRSITPSTASLVRRLKQETIPQAEAITGFLQWALRLLVRSVQEGDEDANVIAQNLHASEMDGILDLAWGPMFVQPTEPESGNLTD